MENQKDQIIVTWDFTNISQCALEHAIRISRTVNKEILMLHIVPPKCSAKELEAKRDNMRLVCEETERRFQIKPSINILEGSIFKNISKYASDTSAAMVVMGTHGIKG
jgi:nucleotide-binding universal stress UspA family protein